MRGFLEKHDSSEVRLHTLACIGTACFLTVLSMILWGGLPWMETLGITLLGTLQYKTVPQSASMAIGIAVLFGMQKRETAVPLCLASTIAMILATDLFFVLRMMGANAPFGEPLIIATSVVIGLSSGSLFYLWGIILMRTTGRKSVQIILLSMMLSSALMVVASVIGGVFPWVFFTVMALGSAFFCLALVQRKSDGKQRCGTGRERGMLAERNKRTVIRSVSWPILLCMAAISFALAIMRTTVLMSLDKKSDLNVIGGIGLFMLASALLLYWFGFPGKKGTVRHVNTLNLYVMVFPLIATASVLVPTLGNSAAVVSASLLFALFVAMSELAVATSVDLAKESSCPSSLMFALCSFCVYFAMAMATFLACVFYHLRALDTTTVTICALVVLYVLAMVYAVAQRRQRNKAIEEAGAATKPADMMANRSVSTILAEELMKRAGLLAERHGLTDRETEVLQRLVAGNTTRGIAAKLFVSENTVRTHLKSLYRKLDVHSKQEIINMVDACKEK